MASLFAGKNLMKWDGSAGSKAPANCLDGKLVALYFSAHWCPPCRAFTPVLKDFYKELEDGKELEIIFVSFDRSEADLISYLKEAHGNWCYIPFGDEMIQTLSEKFGVSGIPQLLVLRPDGTLVSDKARPDVQGGKGPKDTLAKWKKEAGM